MFHRREGTEPTEEMIAVGRGAMPPKERPISKRRRAPGAAPRGTTAREKSAPRRGGADHEMFAVPSPKPIKVTCSGVAESVEPALGLLRKRMSVELDALHALARKVKLLGRGKSRPSLAADQRTRAPTEDGSVMPPAKRMKESPREEGELVDTCGGISPIAIRRPSPVVSVNTAEESGNMILPEAEDEFVDVCGRVSPIAIKDTSAALRSVEDGEIGNSPRSSSSESDSPSSSDSDSDSDSTSDSESDSDSDSDEETVDTVVLPVKNSTASAPQPPSEPLASVAMQSAELKGVQPPPSPAKEAVQSAEPNKNVHAEAAQPGEAKVVCMRGLLYRANLRLALQEMERAVLPDESIRARDLRRLRIAEYGCPSVMGELGLSLIKDDA